MTKLDFNKTCLDSILTELNYFENFKNKYLNRKYERINYGKRIGELSFDGFFDAAKKIHLLKSNIVASNRFRHTRNARSTDRFITKY